jgi:hypothetical protein
MTTNNYTPMTAREAADAFAKHLCLQALAPDVRDWFNTNWPASLSAPQPVAFDVEAVCAEVRRIAHNGDWQERHVDAETLAKSIRRHAAAPATDARAGTAGQSTGAQWVRRPEPQAGALATPRERGVYADVNVAVEYESGAVKVCSAEQASEYIGGGLRHDAVRWCVPFSDIVCDRTPATAGGWTASSVEACVGRKVALHCERDIYVVGKYPESMSAEHVAECFNHADVLVYYILPPVEAQP